MPQSLRGLPDVGRGGIVAASGMSGGQAAQTSAQAFASVAQTAAAAGQRYERRAAERRNVAQQDEAAILMSSIRLEEGRVVIPESELARQNPALHSQAVAQGTLAQVNTQLRQQVTQAQHDHPLNTDAQREALNEWFAGTMDGLDPAIAARVGFEVTQRIEMHLDGVQQQANSAEVEDARGLVLDDLDETHRAMASQIVEFGAGAADSDEFQQLQARREEIITSLQENPAFGITERQANAMRRSINASLEGALADSAISQAFATGGWRAAEATADEIERGLNMTPEEAAAWRAPRQQNIRHMTTMENMRRIEADRAAAERRRIEGERQNMAFNAMRIREAGGVLRLEDVHQSYQAGQIDNNQFTTLTIGLMRDAVSAQGHMETLQAIEAGDLYPDPTDTDTINAVNYATEQLVELAGGWPEIRSNPQAMETFATTLVGQYGIVPGALESTVNGMYANGGPEQVAQALSTVATMSVRNPAAVEAAFSRDILADAAVYERRIQAGATPDEAIGSIIGARDAVAADAREIRRTQAREVLRDVGPPTVRQLFPRSFPLFGDRPNMDGNPAASAAVAAYRSEYEHQFVRYGDHDAAQAAAARSVQSVFQETNTHRGRRSIMPHAPEHHYPAFDGSHDWIVEDLAIDAARELGLPAATRHEVRAARQAMLEAQRNRSPEGRAAVLEAQGEFREARGARSDLVDLMGRITLVSDRVTAREVANGERPSYTVQLVDENGINIAINDRWNPDPSSRNDALAVERQAQIAQHRERAEVLHTQTRAQVNDDEFRQTLRMTYGPDEAEKFMVWRRRNPTAAIGEYNGLAALMFEGGFAMAQEQADGLSQD